MNMNLREIFSTFNNLLMDKLFENSFLFDLV